MISREEVVVSVHLSFLHPSLSLYNDTAQGGKNTGPGLSPTMSGAAMGKAYLPMIEHGAILLAHNQLAPHNQCGSSDLEASHPPKTLVDST